MAEPPVFADHVSARLSGGSSLLIRRGRDDDLIADQLVVGPVGRSGHLVLVHNLQCLEGPEDLIHVPAHLLGIEEYQANGGLGIDDEDGSHCIGPLAGVDHSHLCRNLALIIGDDGKLDFSP